MSEESNTKATSSRLRKWLGVFNQSAISLPMIVFGVLAIGVLSASTLYQENLQRSMEESIDRLSQESQIRTAAKLEAYDLLTRSGIGLLKSSDVDNDSWNEHLQAMHLEEEYGSVLAIGYSNINQPPLSTTPTQYLELRYVYPDSEEVSDAIGTRLSGIDNDFQGSIDAAVRTGAVQLSEVSKSYLSNYEGDGFLQYMFTPVYDADEIPGTEEERIEKLQGVVFLVIDISKLFSSVYQSPDSAIARLRVSGGFEGVRTELFSWSGDKTSNGIIRENQTLDIMGQTYYYDYEFSRPGLLLDSQRYVAIGMPFIGLVVALLLAMLISFTLRARNQRLSIVREREVQAAKDELLSLASHQLRTPATGVKQYLGMVIQGFAGDISSTQRDFLDRAYASNERQLHIINDILYLAKLDAGRIVLTKTEFDLAELLKSICEDLQESGREAGVKLSVTAPKEALALGDGHMIRMVIENLITNAIKYTHPGGKVAISMRSDDKGCYVIDVADTGVGIEPGDIPKLFQQFVRIPNERSNQVSGTGVGLYLARSLAIMHGGDIKVKSRFGEGTTFTLIIPKGL